MGVRVCLEMSGNEWIAYMDGKSSPILEKVPGNAYPARRMRWASRGEAEHSLRLQFGPDVDVYTRSDAK